MGPQNENINTIEKLKKMLILFRTFQSIITSDKLMAIIYNLFIHNSKDMTVFYIMHHSYIYESYTMISNKQNIYCCKMLININNFIYDLRQEDQ